MAQLLELERTTRGGLVSLDLKKYKRDRFGQPQTFALGASADTCDDDTRRAAAHACVTVTRRG